MTQPTMIFMGPDVPRSRSEDALPKIYLRTLLFSTAKRGCVIENMFVSVTRNETRQNFNVWVHGEEKLFRGSGLFVDESGVLANHHFMAPRDGSKFKFLAGEYKLEVFASLLGDKKVKKLYSQALLITSEISMQLEEPEAGLYFDWGPDSSRYIPYVEKRPSAPDADNLLRAFIWHSR